MRRLWLISYDIADDRRRRAVDRLLLGLGDRVLESLFECHLRADQLPALTRRLAACIDPATDRLALLPLCRQCQQATHSHGHGRREGCRADFHFTVV